MGADDSARGLAALGRLRGSFEALAQRAADGQVRAAGSGKPWRAAEVLVHVTFWHEQYVASVRALLAGKRPHPPHGSYGEINDQAVAAAGDRPVAEVVARLWAAQATLELLATQERAATVRFAFKQGSTVRPFAAAMEVADRHVRGHLDELRD